MGNTGVKGRIVYAGTNDGVAGVEIHAWNDDPFDTRIHLGKNVTTGSSGDFSITYNESVYQSWLADHTPSIRVQIFVPTSRLVYETELFKNVTETMLDCGLISIHKNHLGEKTDPNSWLVTNATLDPLQGDPVFLTQNNEVEWLVDGAALFPAVTRAADAANSSINFMNLNFWVAGNLDALNQNDLFVTEFPPGFNSTNQPTVPITGAKKFPEILLNTAVWMDKNVRVVIADVPGYLSNDSVEVNEKYFGTSNVQFRKLHTGPSLLHAKAVIIDDDVAFVAGSGFSQGYFSDQHHNIHDATHKGSLIHDVSVKVKGPAVSYINQTFATIWNKADTASSPALIYSDPATVQPPANPVSLQVLRTFSANGFKTSDKLPQQEFTAGQTSILESYQRAIANATEYIYIEDQYFTNRDIARAILLRMKEVATLEVILVLNIVPDMPGYPTMQLGIISQLADELGDRKNKLGVFTLWSWHKPNAAISKYEIMPVYIHSKTAFIDDKWVTTGSANTDGSAMNYIQVGNMVWGKLAGWADIVLIADALIALGAILASIAVVTVIAVGAILLGLPILILSAFKAVFSKTFAEAFAGSITDWDDGFQHALPKRDDHPYRHAELNIIAFNNVAGQPQTTAISELRKSIWNEHLGFDPTHVLVKDPGGWLNLWNARADEKCQAVKTDQASEIKIMKWQFGDKPSKHLKKLGIDNDKLTLREKADRFDYLTGKWS